MQCNGIEKQEANNGDRWLRDPKMLVNVQLVIKNNFLSIKAQ